MNKILIAVPLAGFLSACGGGSSKPAAAPAVHDKATVVSALSATATSDGLAYTVPLGDGTTCNVAVIMTDAAQVKLYAGAGDTVATNPAKTVGAKIVDDREATCLSAVTKKLATVK
jgi:hypothetical protein